MMAVEQIAGYLENGIIKNSVNLPDVSLPRESAAAPRVCILHKNIPAMLNQITASFSEADINIENMVNKSKGSLAYTVVDLAEGLSVKEAAVSRILAVDGVISVRVL
jgi:D-3-phosphoglycerate dehydrogenase